MRPTRCLSFVLILAQAAAALAAARQSPGARAPEQDAARTLFQGDARLRATVTLALRNRPLGEVLADLAGRLKVGLTPAPEVPDQRVTLFMRVQPAAEALAAVAGAFGLQWTKQGTGYALARTAALKSKEAQEREALLAHAAAPALARLERIARAGAVGEPALRAREKEIAALLSGPESAGDRRAALLEERADIEDALRPGGLIALKIWAGLGSARARQLRVARELRLSTAEGTLDADRSREVHQTIGSRLAAGEEWGAPQRSEAVLRWVLAPELAERLAGGPARPAHLRIGLVSSDGKRVRSLVWSPRLPASPPASPVGAAASTEPALRREVLVRTAAVPRAPPGTRPTQWPAGMVTLGEIAEAIHRQAGLDVLAEAPVRARLDPSALQGRRPVAELLELVSKRLRFDWRKEANRILLADRVGSADRPAQVSERILAPWRRRLLAGKESGLDLLASLANALDEGRAGGMYDCWGWYLEGTPAATNEWGESFNDRRQHLRFWASLTAGQKQAALARRRIPVREMSAAQRRAFFSALRAEPEWSWRLTPFPAAVDAPELLGGSFALAVRQPRGAGPRAGAFTLAYLLPGQSTPARTVDIHLPWTPAAR